MLKLIILTDPILQTNPRLHSAQNASYVTGGAPEHAPSVIPDTPLAHNAVCVSQWASTGMSGQEGKAGDGMEWLHV